MVRSRFEMITILLLLTILLLPSVFASPDTYTLTLSTGDVELTAGVKVKISYSCEATVSHPSKIGKGKTASWDIELESGTIEISVYVPFPVSDWYSESMSIPIGSYYDIPITTGISARVKVVSSASLGLTGDAELSTDSLSWSSEGAQTFDVTTYDSASGEITVESNFNFQINLGLVIGISLFSIEIANMNIGEFPTSPIVSESITIPGGISIPRGIWPYMLVLVVIIGGVIIFSRRK